MKPSLRRRVNAECALIHLRAVADDYQALHSLSIDEPIIRAVIMAQKVNAALIEDVKKSAKIKDEEPAIFLPAFPRATQKLCK